MAFGFGESQKSLVDQFFEATDDEQAVLDLEHVTNIVRQLRNSCATNVSLHKQLGNDVELLSEMCKLVDRIIGFGDSPFSDEEMLCLRLCAQFLGNLTVSSAENQINVHRNCFLTAKKLMLLGDGKLSLYIGMLFYNILSGRPETKDDILLEEDIIREILKEESEFSSFIYEELLLKHGELEELYKLATSGQRLMLLSTIKANKTKEHLAEKLIKFLVETFKRQSDKILKVVSDYVDKVEPQEICFMLETMASISGENEYLPILQSEKSLFINCAFLLRSIHDAGKLGDNCFTSVQRITTGIPDEQLHDNPVFAFKVDLIRLLGNMCWKCKELQDLMRDVECIPVLLECCNIDEKNPFITQWSVLAIRNLCENNKENQAVIAGLSQQGVVSSPVLSELGLTLHSEDGKEINVVPLQR